jgi:polyhydroxyalkanoate synthesis regulator phasin
MAIGNIHDLITLLEQHPEWRAELRRLVLTDELLDLPRLVRELAVAQARTEERINSLAEAQTRTEARLSSLAEAQARTEARISSLADQVQALAEAQTRTEERLSTLVEIQTRMEQRQNRMQDDIGELKGMNLERAHRENAYAYFGQLIRGAHALSAEELGNLVDAAVDRGQLRPEEAIDILRADAVVRGRRRDTGADVYLVAEISWMVGVDDVERAHRRAQRLARIGLPVWPVAAGNDLGPGTDQRAAGAGVALVRRGQWEQPFPGNGGPAATEQ